MIFKITLYEKSESMKLNHYIARAGITSRRKAAELVKEGAVKVNGKIQKDPSYEVKEKDSVVVSGKLIRAEQNLVYILLNKPAGYVTTVSDEKGRKTVLDLLGRKIKERVFPVGRLDLKTTGLLLLTNDGDLAHKLSHPRSEIKKIYHVTLDRLVPLSIIERIKRGIKLYDGVVNVDRVTYWSDKKQDQIKIVLHSGKYQIVRRLFKHLGFTVKELDRVSYAGLKKQRLNKGEWRFLTKDEVKQLKQDVGLK